MNFENVEVRASDNPIVVAPNHVEIECEVLSKLQSPTINTQRTPLVSEKSFPDQSLYLLNNQLQELRRKINRIRFYLDEVNDILPPKKV